MSCAYVLVEDSSDRKYSVRDKTLLIQDFVEFLVSGFHPLSAFIEFLKNSDLVIDAVYPFIPFVNALVEDSPIIILFDVLSSS